MSCLVLLNIINFCTFDIHHDLHVHLICYKVVVGGCLSIISALKCGSFLKGSYGYLGGFFCKKKHVLFWKKLKHLQVYIYNILVSLNMVNSYIYFIKKKKKSNVLGQIGEMCLFVHLFVCSLVCSFLHPSIHPSIQSVSQSLWLFSKPELYLEHSLLFSLFFTLYVCLWIYELFVCLFVGIYCIYIIVFYPRN